MSKKRVVVVVFIIAIVASTAVGYFAAWARGHIRMSHSYAMTHRDILFLTSRSLIRNIDTSGLDGLIDTIEDNGDTWEAIIRAWQLCDRTGDKERIAAALGEWEMARKKLEELRSSPGKSKDPNTGGHVPDMRNESASEEVGAIGRVSRGSPLHNVQRAEEAGLMPCD